MHIITRKRLNEFATQYPDARPSLAHCYGIMRKSRFRNFARLRETFPHADQVGKFTVFNIGGNKARLDVLGVLIEKYEDENVAELNT